MTSLHRPLGTLVDPVSPISITASLGRAAELFRDTGAAALPVVGPEGVEGVLFERDLAQALSMGLEPDAPVSSVALSQIPKLLASVSGAEALRVFTDRGDSAILVVDGMMNVVGIVTPARLYPQHRTPPRPKLVGGMATPFGVYLTNGAQRGGVGPWALVVTGGILFLTVAVTSVVASFAGDGMAAARFHPKLIEALVPALSTAMFLGALRFSPLAGYHAAEHMTVHAIERGEPLHPEIVKRMPRVHPRCGTNLAAGATLFLGILSAPWIPDQELRLLAAFLITMLLWRPLGELMQYYATTRPPNRKQIDAGIQAGVQLLTKYEKAPIVAPSAWMRLLNSGMLQIIGGSLLMSALIQLIGYLTGWEVLKLI